MAKMKVQDFLNEAKKIDNLKTKYQLGKFMNSMSGSYYLCDCSGLIKAILWKIMYGGKYKGTDFPDWNANTIIANCSSVSTNFNKLPLGALVHLDGHIGIHVGDGVCIESTPIWQNGVQQTFIVGSGYSNTKNLKTRKWTKWGKLDKYIDYSTNVDTSIKAGDKIKIDGIYKVDEAKKIYGIYQVKENDLVGSGFAWKENGIPEKYIDLTGSTGLKRPDSDRVHAKKGDYFKFNTTFKVIKKSKDSVNGKMYLYLDPSNALMRFWALESKCKKV